jgi:arylsulfatase A-like enzyme
MYRAATTIIALLICAHAMAVERPNIVFVLVDDMRADQLGITGHPFMKTPHLDRVGREGAVFTNAFVTTPLCSPSRASFLTGQYPHKHRITNNDRVGLSIISHKLVTFPQWLRRAGYETAFIGKWHMGADDTRRPGFDRWISFVGQGLFIDPVVNVDGVRDQYTGYMTELLNGWAVDFVNQPRDRPFLLFLSHKAVHRPFIPADRHSDLYAGESRPHYPEVPGDREGKPALHRQVPKVDMLTIEGVAPEPAEPRYGRGEDKDSIYLDHCRSLAAVDDGVGQLLAALEKSGKLDNTLFIFSSDNGFTFGEHGEYNNKRVAYDPSLRVPLLMRYPRRIPAGSVRGQLALNVDLAPTLYELAGVEAPVPVHGKSLLEVMADGDAPFRERFLAEYFLEKVTPRHATWHALRTAEWKYIHYPGLDGMDELYHLEKDPGEHNNLVEDPDHGKQLARMRQSLDGEREATGFY